MLKMIQENQLKQWNNKKGDNINLTISDGKIKASVLEVQGENNENNTENNVSKYYRRK
ncbi:MAG: hypothetical protein ACLR4C_05890 [Eubacterium ventriosum]